MRIGIIGTRGVPNRYGGFGQLAEYLSRELVKRGHSVAVYNSHDHEYQEKSWEGVQIIHCNDPEHKLGSFGQFIYDYNCIKDSRSRNFDIILQLGYTSSSIWFFLLPKQSKIATNMDGLEWKRSKYNWGVQQFLKVAEWLAAKTSDTLVADSPVIATYLKNKYKEDSIQIAYGAHLFNTPDQNVLTEFKLAPYQYDLIIARMEPENNIETIIKGRVLAKTKRKLIIIGNVNSTPSGLRWKQKYASDEIIFLGTVFDIQKLNNLRFFSNLYFHGHSVGGTNPSLIEAMASKSLICSHENEFNRAVLGEEAFYFENDK